MRISIALGSAWLLASAAFASAAAPAEVLPFIDDDYPAALAQAKAHGLPLFVDVWAPW